MDCEWYYIGSRVTCGNCGMLLEMWSGFEKEYEPENIY